MSSWGNYDNVAVKGNVTTSTSSDLVNGYGVPEFTSNVKEGDYITIATYKYKVQNVVSNTQLYLTTVASSTSANVKAFVQQGPKWISNATASSNSHPTIAYVYGVDRLEMANASANANAHHTGWNYITTYTDAYGTVRVKSEVLVAMSKNFNANATSDLQTDAGDDSVLPE